MHRNLIHATVALALTTLLTGCAFSNGTSAGSNTPTVPSGATHINGTVFGGQQPVAGALIQLYTVNTASIGGASTPLISTTVNTNAAGGFAITGDYACTTATQVYLTATGGNAGSGTNSALTMMAVLGSCSALLAGGNSIFINMNELTTVAAAYALAPYMVDYTHVGAVGTNPAGLVNAFTTAQALVSTATGQVASASSGITLPTARLNTLANILAACVNTAGTASTQCSMLFSATGATETIGAALAIAKNPAAPAITALYTLGSGTPPFVPGITTQPNDFTVAINYTGTELNSPYGLAIDASGNAFVTNEAGSSIVKLPHPAAAFATTTYTGSNTILAPRGISIDRAGNIWLANTGANNVVELTAGSSFATASAFTTGGLATPVAIANDSAGNAFIANLTGNSITVLSASGVASGSSPITNSLASPTGIAIDSTGRILVANAGTGALCTFSNAGAFQSCPTDGTLFGATSIAVNSSTIAMAGSTTGAAVTGAFTLATSAGSINAASPVTGGGLTLPLAVAFDGVGKTWFANAASISAFNGATANTPATGYGALNYPASIAIDPSGNVWTANSGDNSVSIFVGLAAPVATPLAANVGP